MSKNSFLFKGLFLLLLLIVGLTACEKVDFILPEGPQGERGPQGEAGLSAYEIWKRQVEKKIIIWNGGTNIPDFFLYLKGKDGKDGKDGVSPHIGTNGNWWIGSKDTGIPAKGKDGKDGNNGKDGENGQDGVSPHIGSNGNWWIGDKDTGVPAKGEDGKDGKDGKDGENGQDGISPHIGKNGNWWIGDKDTGVPAKGKDGKDGENGENGQNGISPHIGENGNWWIGDKDTGIPAKGKDGKDGKDGAKGNNGDSAYEVWKKFISSGNVPHPHKPGEKWPPEANSEADFWAFLMGAKGENGSNGKDGNDGKDGENGQNGNNGLSTYELWKEDLAKRCGTTNPIRNRNTNEPWDCEKNSLDDFYEFISASCECGNTDFVPPVPGTPGAETPIIDNMFNVIAQFSLANFSEYSHPDGVLYKVYDKNGELAPESIVTGMPGLDPALAFVADTNGEFRIPLNLLPFKDMASFGAPFVKYKGKTRRAARNTFVPNRIHARVRLRSIFYVMGHNILQINSAIEIHRKPGSPWEPVPAHLIDDSRPRFGNYATGYRISNPEDPTSFILDGGGHKISVPFTIDQMFGNFTIKKKIVDSDLILDKSNLWGGEREYYTVDFDLGKYLGVLEGIIIVEVPPVQNLPQIKKLVLHKKIVQDDDTVLFERVTGELDTSTINLDAIFPQSKRKVAIKPERMTVLYPPFTQEEAKAQTVLFVKANYGGEDYADTSEKHPTLGAPTFELKNVRLGSRIYVSYNWSVSSGKSGNIAWNGLDNIHRELIEDPAHPGQYKLKINPLYEGKVAPIEVTYSEE
ncbi:hypothetical protein [Porphyromonas sp. COT-108 OH1349]|uniref:hypothetical protein n=1 Tax=Porphyromonas sp. COT-108 OH1349 TaxID=1537504 RepID=UPI00052BFECA|nr:hypothetical protein [Porphyromonas sp. COT-108 OH1349]KGN70362.1 hypothetical protein JT26_02405 [Porphyromonas sp. COT-108 OH1349]